MHKLILLVLVFVLLFVGAVGAQEATPEVITDAGVASIDPGATNAPVVVIERIDPTIYSVALIVVGVIFLIGFGVLGYVVRPAIIQLGISAPEWALKGVQSGYELGMTKLHEFVSSTETPMDDAAYEEIQRRMDAIFDELQQLRDGRDAHDAAG